MRASSRINKLINKGRDDHRKVFWRVESPLKLLLNVSEEAAALFAGCDKATGVMSEEDEARETVPALLCSPLVITLIRENRVWILAGTRTPSFHIGSESVSMCIHDDMCARGSVCTQWNSQCSFVRFYPFVKCCNTFSLVRRKPCMYKTFPFQKSGKCVPMDTI